MAFTQTDLDNIDSAMVTLAVDGIASVSIDGNSVTVQSPDQLLKLRRMIADTLAGDNISHGGIRTRQLVPGGCG